MTVIWAPPGTNSDFALTLSQQLGSKSPGKLLTSSSKLGLSADTSRSQIHAQFHNLRPTKAGSPYKPMLNRRNKTFTNLPQICPFYSPRTGELGELLMAPSPQVSTTYQHSKFGRGFDIFQCSSMFKINRSLTQVYGLNCLAKWIPKMYHSMLYTLWPRCHRRLNTFSPCSSHS